MYQNLITKENFNIMARKISNNVLKIRGSNGSFTGVPAMCGESSYDIAVRNGFTGTEAEFLAAFAPDNLLQAVTNYKNTVDAIKPAANAAAHNAIYRGKDLTGIYSIDQICTRISNGTFEDLYIGDFISVSINTSLGGTETVKLVLADFNHFYNCGDTALTRNHAVMVPKDCFKTTAKMNATNTTEGGYFASLMNTETLPIYEAALQTALNNHIITHRRWISTAMDPNLDSAAHSGWKGAASNAEWKDFKVSLMSEANLYGILSHSSSGRFDVGVNNRQFNLFRHAPGLLVAGRGNGGSRSSCWLSAVAHSTNFCGCHAGGVSDAYAASTDYGVRPYFLIG